jgi:hypothetical protein
MGFSISAAQCLVAPPYTFAGILMFGTAWVGDKYHIRGPILVFNSVITPIGLPIVVSDYEARATLTESVIGFCVKQCRTLFWCSSGHPRRQCKHSHMHGISSQNCPRPVKACVPLSNTDRIWWPRRYHRSISVPITKCTKIPSWHTRRHRMQHLYNPHCCYQFCLL